MVYVVGEGGGSKKAKASSPKPTVTKVGPPSTPNQPGFYTHAAPPETAASGSVGIHDEEPIHRLINPPHHALSENQFLLGRENARRNPHRGTIVRTSSRAAGDSSYRHRKRYGFRFLYNPETITFNTNVYTGVVPPEFQNPNDPTAGGAKFIGQESVQFSLMLDRTQEVYEQGLQNTRGTLPDLEALYRVANGNIGMAAGFLYLSEVEIHWGPSNALPMFRGYITSINVVHTKFTPHLTPMRSLVEVSVVRLSSPSYEQNAMEEIGSSVPDTAVPYGYGRQGSGMPGTYSPPATSGSTGSSTGGGVQQ